MSVEDTASKIEDMTIRGAGRIARAAASALGEFAGNYRGTDLKVFRLDVRKAADRLLATRPTAISLTNAVKLTLRGHEKQLDLNSSKKIIIENSEKFVRNSDHAVEKIGTLAVGLLRKPSVLITICNSSAAVSAITHCHKAGLVKMVYACETRPKRQGIITVRELASAGVPVTLIVDSAMRFVMPEVDAAFVGSDTIEGDGSVINKIGTSVLATIAKDFGVPFYTCAETYKFMPESKMDQRVEIEQREKDEIIGGEKLPAGIDVFNPVFDRTPPKLITRIITDVGIVKPGDSRKIIKAHLGGI
jgi:ribose 1,5-bisphosphate isomerase